MSIPAVSGAEEEAIEFVYNEFRKYADEVEVDRMGNVIARKVGTGGDSLRVMIPTHLDEIGLIVKYIEPNGFLRIEKVGDLLDYIFPGKRMKVIGDKGPVPGVVGVTPAHLTSVAWGGSERQTSPPVSDQFIDIGVATVKEAEELGVHVGTSVCFDSELTVLGKSKFLAGKAFDDRALVAISIETLKRLRELKHQATVYHVGTVEHEPGLRGVKTATYRVRPNIAIGLDVVIAGDSPGTETRKAPIRLGGGPSIKFMDVDLPGTGQFSHPRVRDLIAETAREKGIPIQFDVCGSGLTTDASAVQWMFDGIPSTVLSLPARYTHGPNEVVNVEDMDNMVELLTASIAKIGCAFDLRRIRA